MGVDASNTCKFRWLFLKKVATSYFLCREQQTQEQAEEEVEDFEPIEKLQQLGINAGDAIPAGLSCGHT